MHCFHPVVADQPVHWLLCTSARMPSHKPRWLQCCLHRLEQPDATRCYTQRHTDRVCTLRSRLQHTSARTAVQNHACQHRHYCVLAAHALPAYQLYVRGLHLHTSRQLECIIEAWAKNTACQPPKQCLAHTHAQRDARSALYGCCTAKQQLLPW